jgi:beta-adrenergic-receptor kinase
LDLENAKNAIKVVGEPVTRVLALLKIISLNSAEEKEGEVTKISMDIFDELDEIVFGYLRDSYYASFKGSFWWSRHYEYLCLTEVKVVEEDFAVFRVLGRGGFGLVNACKKCTTGRLYAMKKLNKKRVKMKNAEPLCLQERNILAIINSPYIVCLKYAFTTHQDLYLILDLMTGGDLGFHLSHKGRFTAKESKYYAARTLLGIAAMHDKNIAYRDLKPENILMDEQGYTKISDLGLACKVGKSGLSGACGTRGYWAPEMLKRDEDGKRERYTLTVDWFSFGCCVYEFMYGMSPFRTDKARRWGEPPISAKVHK